MFASIVNTRLTVLVASLFLGVTGLTGCAAESDDGAKDEEVRLQVEPSEGTVAPTYTARITLKDLHDANAKCVGTTCSINGRSYDCKGGGNCSVVY